MTFSPFFFTSSPEQSKRRTKNQGAERRKGACVSFLQSSFSSFFSFKPRWTSSPKNPSTEFSKTSVSLYCCLYDTFCCLGQLGLALRVLFSFLCPFRPKSLCFFSWLGKGGGRCIRTSSFPDPSSELRSEREEGRK